MKYKNALPAFAISAMLILTTLGCSFTRQPGNALPATPIAAPLADLALVNAILIDGTGADPIPDAVLLLKDDRIVTVGLRNTITIPAETKIIDLDGATILPGFINAHVHDAFNEYHLKAWARGGVTTVRDEGTLDLRSLSELIAFRVRVRDDPQYARIISAGSMITVPAGYGNLFVSSPEDARRKVLEELDAGADMIKISLEDGYAGQHNLPKLTSEEINTIVSVAHERGTKVSGHITQGAYLEEMVNAGVDDVAHIPYDFVDAKVLKRMVEKDIYFTPTFTVFRNYNAPVDTCVLNLRQFVQLGGHTALGNDYSGGPGNFELGIPMYEIEMMSKAGMTPMEIIVASTKNAAHVANIEDKLGTLEPGKIADVLIVGGDPLDDLQALMNIKMVIHGGVVIRDDTED